MKSIGYALMGFTATALFLASEATAQTLCGDRQNFISHLGKNHSEATTAMGLTSSGKAIEVLTSEKGTWTIIVTSPEGRSCLIAAGEDWEAIERIAMEPKA